MLLLDFKIKKTPAQHIKCPYMVFYSRHYQLSIPIICDF